MENEKKNILNSIIFPTIFVLLIWFIKIFEIIYNLKLAKYCIFPMKPESLPGIIFTPLVHSDFSHLYANSFSFIILCIALFYVYKEIAYKVFFIIYFLSGFLLWLSGRENYHIGASALIYGLAGFIFFSGLIRKNKRLMALSLLVSFLYGSMIWGILPIQERISWEGHLMGLVSGLFLAIIYRKYGPQRIIYDWENEDDNDSSSESSNEEVNSDDTSVLSDNKTDINLNHENPDSNNSNSNSISVSYKYIENKNSN